MKTCLKDNDVGRGRAQARMLTALVVAMALLVAACGSQTGTTSGSPGTTPGAGGTTPGAANNPTPTPQPAGQITEFPVPMAHDNLVGITKGPDGNLWFTWSFTPFAGSNGGGKIGRITPAGQITEFPTPTANSSPREIITGPDGNLWFTEYYGNVIGRITP